MKGATVATVPAVALQNTLLDDSKATRVSLSKGARQMAAKLEAAEPDQASNALQVGKLAALVHNWQQSSDLNVRVSVFGAAEQGPVIDLS